MSFSRAKINRFNDVQTDVPSPTRYDPKLGDKAKGGVMGKGERERTMSSTSDTHSTGGTPFRTPFSVVKKHSCVASTEKSERTIVARSMNFGESGLAPLHPNADSHDEALRAEIAAKDHELSEFRKLVNDLTEQARCADDEKAELNFRLSALESAKADLECLVSNNKNCEAQIQELTAKMAELEQQLNSLKSEKSELMEKWTQEENRVAKLEDGNVEYEKRIISLEGTLEQVTLEYNEKVEQVRVLKEQGEKLKTTIECLQGKISALETQVRSLEEEKNTNEQTIFGLEERTSSLNFSLESAKAMVESQQETLQKLEAELEERKKACALHDDTITGLDMQLESKQKDFVKLVAEIDNLKTEKNDLKQQHDEEKKQISAEKDAIISDLTSQLILKKEEIDSMLEERKALIKSHEEEMFLFQNEWEKKILSQMQEAEQAILEKDAVMKLAELKNARQLSEAHAEWEKQLRDAEEEASRRQSAQLEAGEMMKAKYEARFAEMEAAISQVLETKAVESAIQNERYREICQELSAHIEAAKAKNEEFEQLTASNQKTTARLNNMLEEVKILNTENLAKNKELEEMTRKYNEEWKKNEKLSEHLGELDSKMAALTEELGSELKKAKEEASAAKLKNLDLQFKVVTHQDAENKLNAELEASRASFTAQLCDVTSDLTNVKQQCRKFEIAMADTRRSLEALGHRLIESENEVERLNQENETMREKLASVENEKNHADNNYRLLMDIKIDLEQRIEAAEAVEQVLRQKIKELELKNCDLELSKNELQILKDTLEEDKHNYEQTLNNLSDMINAQNLKMIELERASLDQIEAVSQLLIGKLDEFQKFSTEKIQKLNSEINRLEQEKTKIENAYQTKCEDYENLFTDHDILKTACDVANKENETNKAEYEKQQINLENVRSELDRLKIEKEEILHKLEISDESVKNMANDLEEKSTAIFQLNLNEEKQSEKIAALESEVSTKQAALESLNSDITKLKNKYQQKLKKVQENKDKEIDLLKKEVKDYQAKLMKNMDEVAALLLNFETEHQNVEQLEETRKKLMGNIKDLEETVATLQNDLKETCALKDDLTVQLNGAKCEVENLNCKLVNAEKEYAESCEKLNAELAQAKEGGDWKIKWERLLEEKELLSTELLAMTDKKDHYKFHCQRLEKELAQETKDREDTAKDFDEIHNVLKEKEKEIEMLHKRKTELESLIGPFREQLELYESERLMLENDREQLRKQHLEQASKLGHQNHKQKIQHVVKLKNDILELRKENQKLQFDLKNKNKIIENLREEVGEHPKRLFINGKRPTSTPFKGKENDGRMSPIPGVKQEPMSPNPLKDRNF